MNLLHMYLSSVSIHFLLPQMFAYIPIYKNIMCLWIIDHGVLSDEEYDFVTDIEDTVPGKVKPLIKTHKPKPWPIRLLLSGSNTPVQPLSKYVQFNIRHLPHHLPHQIVDTKDFLQKIAKIN